MTTSGGASCPDAAPGASVPAANESVNGLLASGQLGPAHQLAETRVRAQVVEIVVGPEHALRVETRVDGLSQPSERLVDVALARLGAGEIVERRGLAIVEQKGGLEMLRGRRLIVRVEPRVAGVEPRPAGLFVVRGVRLEGLRRFLPCRDVGSPKAAADPQPGHGKRVLHLEDLAEARGVMKGGQIRVGAHELRIVEAALDRPLELEERGIIFALESERAGRVVERGARLHRSLRGFAERVGRAVVLARPEELLSNRVPGVGAGRRIVAHLLETRNRLAGARLAGGALLAYAAHEVAEPRVGPQGDEVVVLHQVGGKIESGI